MNKYEAYYRKKNCIVEAATSYEAQLKAAAEFKARKTYDVHVFLIEKDGKEVVHTPTF